MTANYIDLAKAERAVLKAKAGLEASEQQQAAYEVQGLTRLSQLAARYRRKAEDRHARAVADLDKLRHESVGSD